MDFLGFLFAIGAIIEEAQGNHDQNNYISERKCSRARSLLVLKWTVLGFLLTISYKSVLRAMMMKVDYEDTIDTIDDMLLSGRKLLVAGDTGLKFLIKGDPRMKVKQLAKQVEFLNRGTEAPDWVYEG